MLDIIATIDGEKQVIDGLERTADNVRPAVSRGLVASIRGINDEAMKLLSGPGRTPVRTQGRREWIATGYRNVNPTRFRGQMSMLGARPGSYPGIPVLTGNLRARQGFLEPGQSKRGPAGTFTAGPDEVVAFDSAAYADTIHEGKGSSKKYGKRPFEVDAVQNYGGVGRIRQNIEEELAKEIARNQ